MRISSGPDADFVLRLSALEANFDAGNDTDFVFAFLAQEAEISFFPQAAFTFRPGLSA